MVNMREVEAQIFWKTQHLLKFSAFLVVCALPRPFSGLGRQRLKTSHSVTQASPYYRDNSFKSLDFTCFLTRLNTSWHGLRISFQSTKILRFLTFNTVAPRGLIKKKTNTKNSSPRGVRPLLAFSGQARGEQGAKKQHGPPGRTKAYIPSYCLTASCLPLEPYSFLHTKNISVNLTLELLLKETEQQNPTC